MLMPNLRSASSAASSAFSMSLSRFAASERNREMSPSDSRKASLLVRSLSVASGEVVSAVVSSAAGGIVESAEEL